jgi:hypothetical protein
MHGLAIRAVHEGTLGEAQRFLIETHGCGNVGNGQRGGNRALLFLIEWIDLLLRHNEVAPFAANILARSDEAGTLPAGNIILAVK